MHEELLARLIDGVKATSAAEAVTVVLGIAYVILAARRSRWCWVAGGMSSAILIYLSLLARLPMQAALNLWYVLMSAYGWYHWSREAGTTIRLWPAGRHAAAIALALLGAALAAHVLQGSAEAAWPFLDSATTLLSLVATYLVARMVLENWIYWIAIDAVLVFLYAAQGLYFIALQFIVYLIVAMVGLLAWIRLYRQTSPR